MRPPKVVLMQATECVGTDRIATHMTNSSGPEWQGRAL